MKLIRLAFMVLLVSSWIWVMGCGDDDDPGVLTPPPPQLDIRDGAWLFENQWTPCDNNPFTQVVLDTICEVTAETFEGFASGIPMECEFELTGTGEFTVNCSGGSPLGVCTLLISVAGEGTYTDTTVTGLVSVATRAIGDSPTCDLVAPCTTWIDVSGEWLAPATCD